MPLHFDPIMMLFTLPGLLLAIYAQFKLKWIYAKAKNIPSYQRISGAETAKLILQSKGITNVKIERVQGELTDHYDPTHKVLRLSEEVYSGTSLASVGIAAHEVGHAIQDFERYPLLVIRNGIVPLAAAGGNLSMILILIGSLLSAFNLIILGVIAFSATVLFQIINLPVEFDASRRAKEVLVQRGLCSGNEMGTVNGVLNIAAMTYVAATLTAILQLVYYLYRLGIIGGGRDRE